MDKSDRTNWTLSDYAAALAANAPQPLVRETSEPPPPKTDESEVRGDFENNDVHRVCELYGISAQVESKLQILVTSLQVVKEKVWAESNTPGERKEVLREIIAKANELKLLIVGLPFADRYNLDDAYFGAPGDPHFDHLMGLVKDTSMFSLGDKVLPDIENAAKKVQARMKGVCKPERSADFIRCIAQALKPANIIPSYSGPFKEISIAVFADGGVTLSGKEIQFFMKNIRPQVKAQGYCL
ncbi:MAG: hypothetical protein DID92_2727744152 [Candidatus Nitrotoga sp. SPKER]|nr:MAG: hypothetical protein DID92_2727744152 [Candidatus Nitrotoga sp. SPKER]